MKLRTRLGLTAALVIVPTVAALLCFDAIARHRAAEQLLTAIVSSRLPMERERCEASPASWGGLLPGGPPPFSRAPRPPEQRDPAPDRLPALGGPPADRSDPPHEGPPPYGGTRRARPAVAYAYDEHFVARNPAAPPIPPALARSIETRESAVETLAWRTSEVEVLLRTPWGAGPCAFVLAHGTTGEWGAVLPESWVWLLPMVLVFAAVLVAMGPVVRRIRLLTSAVQHSAALSYGQPVLLPGNDEIGELARAFDQAGRQISSQLRERERRERALRDFIANTTHDVMIPLTVLQGHLTTLRESIAAGVDPTVVSSAMDEAHYMASLVHNLALAARLDAVEPQLQRTRVDMGALVARVVARHTPVARERGVSLESACPDQTLESSADLTLLEQAISNITYNAVRYNRPGGHVAVVLEALPERRFCVRVTDDGPGIPPDELSKLIERGARGEKARTRAPEGQGLGLHIAYRAAELHGFQLTLGPSEYGGLEAKIEGTLAI